MRTNAKDGSWIQGRNGLCYIGELSIDEDGGWVSIDGINKRGVFINGGLYVDREAFVRAALGCLKEIGMVVHVEVDANARGGRN